MEGNEKADFLAKKTLKNTEIGLSIPLSKFEVKGIIKRAIKGYWQERWDKEGKGRLLYRIQREVGHKRVVCGNRREDVVISHLCIGHMALNHSLNVIGKHESGLCNNCKKPETVEHVLLECTRYRNERIKLENQIKSIGLSGLSIQNLLRNSSQVFKILL